MIKKRRIIFSSSLESLSDSSEEENNIMKKNQIYDGKSESIKNTDVVESIQKNEGGYSNRKIELRDEMFLIENQYSLDKLKMAVRYGNDVPRLFGIFGYYYEIYMTKYMSILSAEPCRVLDSIYLNDIEDCTYECILAHITTQLGLPVPIFWRYTNPLEELAGIDYKRRIEDLCYDFWENGRNIMVIPIKLDDNCLNYRILSMLYALESANLIFILGSNMSKEIQIGKLGGADIFYKYFGIETVFYADRK